MKISRNISFKSVKKKRRKRKKENYLHENTLKYFSFRNPDV